MANRLPTHLVVAGLIRAAQAAGGFATVIEKGERDAGTLLLVCCERGAGAAAFELMPQPDGGRTWTVSREQDPENPQDFWEYCARRHRQDPDLWVIELDVPNPAHFVENLNT